MKTEDENWRSLRGWLIGEGRAWTQWAQMGDIASDLANEVLTKFGIEATTTATARLRREVDAVRARGGRRSSSRWR